MGNWNKRVPIFYSLDNIIFNCEARIVIWCMGSLVSRMLLDGARLWKVFLSIMWTRAARGNPNLAGIEVVLCNFKG